MTIKHEVATKTADDPAMICGNPRDERVKHMTADSRTAERPALITFGERWELDGDYLRCRSCRRPQIVSFSLHDFPHAAGCRGAAHECNPWKTLAGLITAQIARAKHPAEVGGSRT